MPDYGGYWSSSEAGGDFAYVVNLFFGEADRGDDRVEKDHSVRAVLAFTVEAPAGPTAYTLANSEVGMIVGTDGKAYAVADKDNLPEGVTAAGMVAYKDGSNGLAIALADEGQMYWATAKSTCEGKTAIGGYSWKLPTMDEWKQMFRANGGNENEFTGLNNALAAAGGDSSKLQESVYYWSSSEYYDDDAWDINLFGEYGVRWYRDNKEDEAYHVRACLAF